MSERRTADLEAQIEEQRDQLAETIDGLSHKLDVKAQAKERAQKVADRTTTETGRPRPEMVAAVVGVVLLGGLLVWWRRR